MKRLWSQVRKWWDGDVYSWEGENVFGIGINRHWTSRAAHAVWDFFKLHWQWIVGITVTVVFGILAL